MAPADRRRTGRLLATVLLTVVLAAGGSRAVHASTDVAADVPADEAAELARRAVDDRGARRDLASITSVDGEPVQLDSLLEGDEQIVEERLGELAAHWEESTPSDPTPASTDELRAAADEVLEAEKFHERSVPKPFRGVLRWIGEVLSDIYRPIESALAPIVGPGAVPWVVLGAAGALAAFLASRFIAARSRAEVRSRTEEALRLDPTTDPDALEAAARQADVDGEHGRGIRLRHEAGLLRLARRGRLELRPETTARGAARAIADPRLDELTDVFEAVVYGDRPAHRDDGEQFRERWADVLDDRSRTDRSTRKRLGT